MFTYDVVGSTIGKIRLLVGDTVQANANFQDEEIQAVLDNVQFLVNGGGYNYTVGGVPESQILLEAAAGVLDALAAKIAASPNGQTYQIGDYKLTGKDQVQKVQDIAQRYRDAVSNYPAWAVADENLSGFNELLIIRNWILRTEF